MAGPSSLLAQYANAIAPKSTPDIKREQVDQAARKKLEDFGVPTPEQMYDVVTARRNGTGTSMPQGPMQDLRTGNLRDLYNTYGPQQASSLVSAYAQAAGRQFIDRTSDRDGWQTIDDAVSNTVLGGVNSVGGLAALGIGLVNDNAGAAVSQGLDSFNEWARSNQSSALNNRRRAYESTNRVAAQDNQMLYEQEKQAYGDFIASLRRIGRDAYSSVSNAADDTAILGAGAAEGMGSLLTGGPLAKGAKALAGKAIASAAKRGVIAEGGAAAGRLTTLTDRAAMPGVIGAMEAGGSYTGAVNDVMAMSHDDLMRTSPKYAELIQQGWDPEEAKRDVATSGGLTAAAIQLPIAALSGKLVSKFEASPFKVPSLGSAARSIGLETVEEGIQSGSGQVASNLGIQAFADPNRDLSQGVGEQVGLGALYGSMSAGAVQAPGMAGRAVAGTAKGIAKGTMWGVGKASNAIVGRIKRVEEQNEASSPLNDRVMGEALREYDQAAPDISTGLKQAVDQTDATPEQKAESFQYVDDYFAASKFDPTPFMDQSTPAPIRDTLAGATDKFDAVQRLAKLVNDTDSNSPEFAQAAFTFYSLMSEYRDLATRQMPETILALPDDHPALAKLREHQAILANIDNTPKAVKAFQQIASILEQQAAARTESIDLTPEMAQTPEGQTIVQQAAMAAEVAPLTVDQQLAEQISKHSEDGTIQLNPRQKAAINGALAVVRAANAANQTQSRLQLRNQDAVAGEITTNDKAERGFKSAYAYMRDITKAVRSGNLKRAKAEMKDMLEFAQHLQNKLDAINRTVGTEGGMANRMQFQAVNSQSRKPYTAQGPAIHFDRTGSIELAQRIAVEADAVTRAANDLAALFPGLEAQPIKRRELDPFLNRPAAEVVADAKQGKRRAEPQTQSEATAQSAAEALQEQAPAKVENETTSTQTETNSIEQDAAPDQSAETPTAEVTNVPSDPVSKPEAQNESTDQAQTETQSEGKADDTGSVAGNQSDAPDSANPVEDSELTVTAPVTNADQETPSEQAKPQPAKKGIEGVFPNLLGSKTKALTNWFVKAFKIPENPKTRLFGMPVIATLRQVMANGVSLASFVETGDRVDKVARKVERKFTPEVAAAYAETLDLAEKMADTMEANLQKRLKEDYSGKSIEERLRDGRPINRELLGKALNITQENDDGSFTYVRELIEGAALAGIQWVLNQDKHIGTMDKERASKILGMPESEVRDEWVQKLQQGVGLEQLTQDLTQEITKFWGLSRSGQAPDGYTVGIPEAIAKEVVRALLKNGQMQTDSFWVFRETGPQKYVTYIPKSKDLADPRLRYPTAIEEVILLETEKARHIGTPPTKVATHQLRNKLVPLTKGERAELSNEQNTSHGLNMNMIRFYKALDEFGMVKLFGAGQLEGRPLNKNNLKSLEGKNLSIQGAYLSLMSLVAEVEAEAEAAGVNLEDMPIYFEYQKSSVGRTQMQGRYNPQASKEAREAILPTWSTVDLSNRNTQHFANFGLALAQALGIKIEQVKKRKDILDKVLTKLEETYPKSVEIMGNWLANSEGSEITEFRSEWIDTIKAEFGGKPSNVAIHAIMEYARWQNASPDERKAFKTALYVEADGKTNGPANAMMNLTSGEFTENWLRNMAKTGFLTGNGQTLADQYGEDQEDLYQTVADKLRDLLKYNLKNPDSKADATQLDAVMTLLTLLIDDVRLERKSNGKAKLVLDRGIAKNPLTITIYGSSQMGIAGNLADQLLDTIYERFSDAAEAKLRNPKLSDAMAMFGEMSNGDPELAQINWNKFNGSLNQLLEFQIIRKGKYGPWLKAIERKEPAKRGWGFQNKTYDAVDFKALRGNLLEVFVGPLDAAIDETMAGNTRDNATLLRKATQAQSIFMQYDFQREVAKLYESKRKDPDWKVGDFLYQREIEEILRQLISKYPLVSTGNQSFLVVGRSGAAIDSNSLKRADAKTQSEATDKVQKNPALSLALDGTMRTDAEVSGPADAGVAGIPYLVIGTGDAHAMQILSTMENAPQGTIKIFDGVHLKLTTLDEDGIKANEAAWSAWQSNPMKAVAESFKASLPNMTEDMGEAQRLALAGAFFKGQPGWRETPISTIMAYLRSLPNRLDQVAKEVDARHKVLSKIKFSVDQLAGIGAPYVNENGIDLSNLSYEQQAEVLNEMLREELSQSQEAEDNTRYLFGDETPVKIAEPIEKALQQVGRVDTKSGARVLSFTAVKNLNRILKAFPTSQQEVLSDVLRSLASKGYTVVVGSPAQTQAYARNHGKSHVPYNSGDKGVVRYSDKTIYLYEPSLETLVHELIHAATFEKVVGALNGDLKNAEQVEAVQRIEALMNQFMDISKTFSIEEGLAEANMAARRAIQAALNDATISPILARAKALNEFMAWSLSNEALIKQGKANQAKGIALLAQKAAAFIKKLVFGRKQAALPGNDMFSQLRFNTAILMQGQPSLFAQLGDTVSYQNAAYGQDDRLVALNQMLNDKIAVFLDSGDVHAKTRADNEVQDAITVGGNMALMFQAHGFPMTAQEQTTFEMMMQVMATSIKLDGNVMSRVQELYAHVEKTLTPSDFMADPESLDPAEEAAAQERYNAVMGKFLTLKDTKGRSTLMSSFLALATTNARFRDVLAKMEVPKNSRRKAKDLDGVLQNLGNEAMESLSLKMSGQNAKATNIKDALDSLNAAMVAMTQKRQGIIDQIAAPTGRKIDQLNQWVVDGMGTLSRAAANKAQNVIDTTNSKAAKAAAQVVKIAAQMVTEEGGEAVASGAMSLVNKSDLPLAFKRLVSDFVGRTLSNQEVYDMIKLVRSTVQAVRQQFREHLPDTIANQFTRKIKDHEWTAMFKGMAMTDLAALKTFGRMSQTQVIELLADSSLRADKIRSLENDIRQMDPKHWNLLQKKSKELAHFMVTREAAQNQLRNAVAVADLLGERVRNRPAASKEMISALNQLISLYAVNELDQNTKDTLVALAQTESKGMGFSLAQLEYNRKQEVLKADANGAKYNHYKGYAPMESDGSSSLVIEDDRNYADLVSRGYVRVAPYQPSSLELIGGGKYARRSYYYAPVSARAGYNQGIAQNIRPTAAGVDLDTGYTTGIMTAGRITDPVVIKDILDFSMTEQGSALLPVFSSAGEVVAFERSVDPVQLARLEQSTHLAKMLGAWRGRQVEESLAENVNETLVDNLKAMYDRDLNENPDKKREYVDLFDTTKLDPVLQDSMKLMTDEMKFYIRGVFGDRFMVRKDMVEDVIGYRSASIGDNWTGNTRLPKPVQEGIKNVATAAFGNDAYRYLVNAEKLLQNLVIEAKLFIVIKSVIVPVSNMAANVIQLSSRGVPMLDIVRGMKKKTAEVDSYTRSRLRLLDAQAELAAVEDDPFKRRKLQNEIQSIQDGHRRLSIWPLIEAGEFSSISDVAITHDEILLSSGKLNAYIEKQVDKLPQEVRTAGRYAIISRDTALFAGLQRAVQYGDFLAKAVLYDDLTTRGGKSQAEALGRISEEFVNYDRLPGRFRGALENNGLMWFYHFKIRSTKIAMSMLRNNPVHALLASFIPVPDFFGSVGSPVVDNVVAMGLEGKLDYSLGPGQMFRSPMLLPWLNLVN